MDRSKYALVVIALVVVFVPYCVGTSSETKFQSPDALMTVPDAANPPSYVFPLRLSPEDGLYLVDQISQPFFINGESAWSLVVQARREEVDTYLADRRSKGYNSIMVNLIDHAFGFNAPADIYGDQPFIPAGNFESPNEAYFAHADYVINKAAQNGIVVLLAPLYLGYNCGSEGWCQEVRNSSLATMRAYGRFVGNRYKDSPNILWLIGGDTDPIANGVEDRVREVVAGIREHDTVHLMTAHNGPEQSAMAVWSSEPWLNLNNVYTYRESYLESIQQYNRKPFKPVFLSETFYENDRPSTTPLLLRSQAYGAVLSGAYLGHYFGNCPIWSFGAAPSFCNQTDWMAQLNSEGSRTLALVGKLFWSRPFYRLIPDQGHTVLTAGYQSGWTYAPAAISKDNGTVIAYIPTPRTVTVDMTRLAGRTARAMWFDPSTGQFKLIGYFPTTGSRNFTSPSNADWVLLLDTLLSSQR